jgi:hypothetical protein
MVKPTTEDAHWCLNKTALVHAPEFDVSCLARLRVGYNQSLNQGFLSIKIVLKLAGFHSGSQVLTLSIPPEKVDRLTVTSISDDSLIPARMFDKLRGVTDASTVSTCILCLNATGNVLVPAEVTTSLKPADPSDTDFFAFSRICRTKTIRLHFSNKQFVKDDLLRLRSFASSLLTRSLTEAPLNYGRINSGRGIQSKDWTVFDRSTSPPPYEQIISSDSDCVLGKRPRDPASSPRSDYVLQRLARHAPCHRGHQPRSILPPRSTLPPNPTSPPRSMPRPKSTVPPQSMLLLWPKALLSQVALTETPSHPDTLPLVPVPQHLSVLQSSPVGLGSNKKTA